MRDSSMDVVDIEEGLRALKARQFNPENFDADGMERLSELTDAALLARYFGQCLRMRSLNAAEHTLPQRSICSFAEP